MRKGRSPTGRALAKCNVRLGRGRTYLPCFAQPAVWDEEPAIVRFGGALNRARVRGITIKQVGICRLSQPGHRLVVCRMVQVTFEDDAMRIPARLEQVTDIPRQRRLSRPRDTLKDNQLRLSHEHILTGRVRLLPFTR